MPVRRRASTPGRRLVRRLPAFRPERQSRRGAGGAARRPTDDPPRCRPSLAPDPAGSRRLSMKRRDALASALGAVATSLVGRELAAADLAATDSGGADLDGLDDYVGRVRGDWKNVGVA